MGNKMNRDFLKTDTIIEQESFKEMVKVQQEMIHTAAGRRPPDIIFKNAGVINVFTEEIEIADIAVSEGHIVGVGDYACYYECRLPCIIDCTGKYVSPGFIDGHIHIESSMLSPAAFSDTVVPHGTTAVITDPHEIVNVAGKEGLQYMLEESENLPLEVYFMLPSCVPATPLEESGCAFLAEDLEPFMGGEKVLGLAEVMNFYGTVQGEEELMKKISLTKAYGKLIDGHGPGLGKNALNAYVCAGITNDHECSTKEEAVEKLSRGQWIMIREGTAAKNMENLKALLKPPYYHRCILVTDDKHPGDLQYSGHVDSLLRRAVSLNADPIQAIKMVTLHPAQCFGLTKKGAVAPGYQADLVLFEDLSEFSIKAVYKGGKLVAENGEMKRKAAIKTEGKKKDIFISVHVKELKEEDFFFQEDGQYMRIIELVPGELLTKEIVLPVLDRKEFDIKSGIQVEEDIIKLAAIERHHNTGHIGLGLLRGYGLKDGAIASSVAHDSHNLIVAGCKESDMALAANVVRKNQGGLAIVLDGEVLGELPLPVGGLMSEDSASDVDKLLEIMKNEAKKLGIKQGIDPFMTLAFISLSVIPEIRITTYGLARVNTQEICRTFFDI